jgi:hypothetical protein
MKNLRQHDFYKRPGVAETLDWAQAIVLLEKSDIDEEIMDMTSGCLFKFREDIKRFREGKKEFLITDGE